MLKLLVFLAVLMIIGGLLVGREAKQVKKVINNRYQVINELISGEGVNNEKIQ